MKNIHSDLDKYTDQWEKALKDGFMDDSPHLPPPEAPGHSDFFGQWDGGEDTPLNECDAKYWAQVYELSKGNGPGTAPDPLTAIKEERAATKAELKFVTDKVGNAANPIYPYSAGKDQDMQPTANWTDGKELRELAELKKKLEKLESQMNAEEGNGKSGASIQKQIDSMRQKLDDLSDSLNGNRFQGNVGEE
jgi:hypothetical protein